MDRRKRFYRVTKRDLTPRSRIQGWKQLTKFTEELETIHTTKYANQLSSSKSQSAMTEYEVNKNSRNEDKNENLSDFVDNLFSIAKDTPNTSVSHLDKARDSKKNIRQTKSKLNVRIQYLDFCDFDHSDTSAVNDRI